MSLSYQCFYKYRFANIAIPRNTKRRLKFYYHNNIRYNISYEMMSTNDDILVELKEEEIKELLLIYKEIDEAFHAYTLIDMVLRWKNQQKRIKMTVTSPEGTWRKDGSIVVFLDYRSKSVVPFSLDKTYSNIHKALLETNQISPSEHCYFLNICESFVDVIMDAIRTLQRRIVFKLDGLLFAMSIAEAKSIEVVLPDNTYLRRLSKEHSEKINEVWPHNFENSQEFIAVYIEQNGGYGLFNEDDDELVAWVLQGHLGHINLLQTKEEYRGKGYGKVMLQVISRHIAESGCVPVGSVLEDNLPSIRLFEKLGFKMASKTHYIFTGGSSRETGQKMTQLAI